MRSTVSAAGRWKVVASVTPAIGSGHRRGHPPCRQHQLRDHLLPATRWRDTSKVIETAYSGLVANEAVFVHGRVAAGGLEAIPVGSGTRASSPRHDGRQRRRGVVAGVGFQIVGGALLLAGIAMGLSTARG